MARKTTKRKEIKYLNKDFPEMRNSLIKFAENYFPNSYNDFNETSPGMMFIEMAAYVGDVLSFYIDRQYKETLLKYAEDKKNEIAIAENFGYKVKLSSPSTAELEVFCVVPSDNTDTNHPQPDLRYAPILNNGFTAQSSQGNTDFRSVDDVNFSEESVFSPRTATIYEKSGALPTKWLLKKIVRVESTKVHSVTFSFGNNTKKFPKRTLTSPSLVEILDVTDSDGNIWYEVPYLAQDTIFDETANAGGGDPELKQFSSETPSLLKLKKTSRRFITRVNQNDQMDLIFGSGISDNADEEIIPNPSNIGTNLPGSAAKIDFAFDPSNFLYTKTYGQVPQNTKLTVRYTTGGGLASNVNSNTITSVGSINFNNDIYGTDVDLDTNQWVKASIAVNNIDPATGGRSGETVDEIRLNAHAYFATQNRAVTREDYLTRVYSLPSKYGSIAKCYIVQDSQLQESDSVVVTSNDSPGKAGEGTNPAAGGNGKSDPTLPDRSGGIQGQAKQQTKSITKPSNPFALNFYMLGFNSQKQLVPLNAAIKANLKTYLSQYRLLTDAINIKTAYVIHIGIEFEISVLTGFNKRDCVARCMVRLKELLKIDNLNINQPIIKGDLIYELSLIEGVQNIITLDFTNKFDKISGYSGNVYDIQEALRNEILYPSADPSIFEIKYPNKDIRGRAV